MSEAKRDQNYVPTLLGVSSADGTTPVTLYADPTTHRLYVDIPGSTGDVVGPASAVDGNFASFDTTTGKLIKDSGSKAADFMAAGSVTQYTDEMAQDAVGGMVDTTLTYTDGTPELKVTNPVTPQTVGFTISAGTTAKTLTVALDASVSGTNTGDNAANTSIAATKLDDFATPDDNTDLNANTTNHGLLLKATAPAAGLYNYVGITNGETAYTNKALFDATAPSTQAFGDSADTGSAAVAARRDHKHAMMAAPTSVSGNAGTVTVAAETGDTTCSVLFATDTSGSLSPKTNTNLTFNASTGVLTSASAVLTTADINGGTVDNVTIGATTASTGKFTTVETTGNIELGAATDTTIARVSAGVISVEGVTIPTVSSTSTLTAKRINPRLVTTASYTTDTGTSLDVSTCDQFEVTAQAGALKLNNPGGTPTGGQKLIVRIKDNGTARALTYDTQFRAMGVALPSTTVISKTLYLGFVFNATDTKWDLIASAQEA